MDLGLKRQVTAADSRSVRAKPQPARGEVALEDDSTEAIKTLLAQVAKLTLSNSREVALVRGAMTTVIIFDRKPGTMGDNLMKEMKDTTASYAKQAKDMSSTERQTFASPHIFVWHAYLMFMQKECPGKQPLVVNVQKYLDWIDQQAMEAEKAGRDKNQAARAAIAAQVKIMRFSTCYDPTKAKMEYYIVGAEAEGAFNECAKVMKEVLNGQVKQGQAPRGDLERKIAAALQSSASDK
eukprot:TRINITY_DN38467_c0_g1_i1.p2 TRINITY_DN38467_c0_g1~~TRINITY_DN38467_c0_g1_i1.p2  ORF type:complete len:268 (-),score=83.45 TRINITY_DN38467_c0_g1_i1:256-969(-)